jgi:hypothetical protein
MAGENARLAVADLQAGDVSVFVGQARLPPEHPQTPINLDMGRMALSTAGNTSIYSGGFAGCLGIIVVPTSGAGGAVSHIHQMRNRAGQREAYLLEAASKSVDLARAYFPSKVFKVILFRGSVTNDENSPTPEIEYRRLAIDLMSLPCVQGILDLRQQRQRAGDQLLYDARRKRLFCWGGTYSDAFIDAIETNEGRVPVIASGELELTHGTRGLPYKIYS